MGPIFIPEPQILSKISLNMSYHFPKLLSFQANFRNFGIRLMKSGLFSRQFKKIWKYYPCLYQFLHWIRGHRYTRRLILRPISAARPRIDLCTKNLPPPRYIFKMLWACLLIMSVSVSKLQMGDFPVAMFLITYTWRVCSSIRRLRN